MPSDIATSEAVEVGSADGEQPKKALERALSECENPEVTYHIRQALQHVETQ
jgi:hypothetical protein